ncbi:abortive infection family protein [Pseudomonas aeruginosa]|uniref:abortive infection family protein n=1 Tax=Pseudomonas aeruginosa TaxID=287 RepID=UPI000BB6AF89|nr:abortive infection family protein [Pseudomonas aeruginosa]ELM5709115.1 abortive infection family protein [Pseudomonas aeruginosa]MCU8982730.1 abortive infection family protein [Pseudomonas aeruginosa]MCU8988142.1 abortive infection family protein [Pseudomonas aeruginosa]MCU8994371.1 abortive infection family protein [Pseudomonas aeruginosa]MCU9000643.1 abortive infection family protein [Pseudomonas aeruginosa]
MTLDWCPGIREACAHWRNAPMLQQTFEALERTLEQENDACIDCAKALVEVVCQVVVDSFHTQQAPLKPIQETPTLSDWLTAAIRALKLGDVRDERFKKLVSSHHKLANALNDLRNKGGPASHGKDPYLERLAVHHRRSSVLAADAIVAFLYQAYLDAQLDPISSREPWERFAMDNALIDAHVGLAVDAEDDDSLTLRFMLPGGDELPINIEVSRLLYQLDRDAYVEALNAARGAPAPIMGPVDKQGEP